MQYLVEITQIIGLWRLQVDGSWRQIDLQDQAVKETDRAFTQSSDLAPYQQRDMAVSLGGAVVTVNPTDPVTIGELYTTAFRVVRDQAPHTPTPDELYQVIRAGNDHLTNTLVIDLAGYFRLRSWVRGYHPGRDLDISVRMETFSAGNGYVGQAAAADGKYLARLYRDYMWLWQQHQKTGELNIFADATPA